MQKDFFWISITGIILCLMFLGNKKVRILGIFKEQFNVFRNDKNNKLSIWDIVCFLIFPIIVAVIITIRFNCIIDNNLANVLTTVFAFVFTVLFGFAAILVGKMDSGVELEKQVVKETFVSIMTSNILALLSAILSIVLIFNQSRNVDIIVSICIYSLSFMIIMLIFMISKRTFKIYISKLR